MRCKQQKETRLRSREHKMEACLCASLPSLRAAFQVERQGANCRSFELGRRVSLSLSLLYAIRERKTPTSGGEGGKGRNSADLGAHVARCSVGSACASYTHLWCLCAADVSLIVPIPFQALAVLPILEPLRSFAPLSLCSARWRAALLDSISFLSPARIPPLASENRRSMRRQRVRALTHTHTRGNTQSALARGWALRGSPSSPFPLLLPSSLSLSLRRLDRCCRDPLAHISCCCCCCFSCIAPPCMQDSVRVCGRKRVSEQQLTEKGAHEKRLLDRESKEVDSAKVSEYYSWHTHHSAHKYRPIHRDLFT